MASHGGSIAGVKAWTNGCMSVEERSCFSYHVAAGRTMSDSSVVEVIRKSAERSRSSLPSGASSLHTTSDGLGAAGFSLPMTFEWVPSRCLRKYSLPFAEAHEVRAPEHQRARPVLRGVDVLDRRAEGAVPRALATYAAGLAAVPFVDGGLRGLGDLQRVAENCG